MKKIRCLIIDDEPLSQEVIKGFIREISWLELEGVSYNAIEAIQQLEEKKPDLIFLDINMPKLSGISFARSLERSPMIIFITAYPEFAVEGFEVDAVDYLVKPVAFERFFKAITKAKDVFDLKEKKEYRVSSKEFIILKSDKKIFKVNESEILYIQSYGDYIKVFTGDKMIMAMETMMNIEEELADNFVRIHKSYIVPLNSIRYIEGNQVRIENKFLPIGQKYREELLEKLNRKH